MPLNRPDDIRFYTHAWEGERFDNGRPCVPDDILERMRLVTTEEAWGVLRGHGYARQFAGDWMVTPPDRILVGRAVTAQFVPHRPELNEAVERWGAEHGGIGGQNSWVIDTLVKDDVVVVDLFGKVKDGTYAGDNLGTAIANKTGAGMVIDGGVRDMQRLCEIPELSIFCRGVDPTAIADVTLTGLNNPIRIGEATVLPGDVVLGTSTGVIFIPPHLAQEVVERSEAIRLQDQWGQMRLREGKYTPGQVDGAWTDEMKADFAEWSKSQS